MMREGDGRAHLRLVDHQTFPGIGPPMGVGIAVGALFSFLFFSLIPSALAFVPHRYPAWRRM